MAGSAAVSVLDSKASFLKQCRGAGVADSWAQAFVTQGVGALGKLAYAVGVPGVQVSVDALTEFLGNVRPGTTPTLGIQRTASPSSGRRGRGRGRGHQKRKRGSKKEKKVAAKAAAAKKQATREKGEKNQRVKRGPAPKAFSGLHTRTPEGDPVCHGFGLDGCTEPAAAGGMSARALVVTRRNPSATARSESQGRCPPARRLAP